MINFYLPDFYYKYDLNIKLIKLFRAKQYLFYDNINIGAVYGSFPCSIWNGGRVFGAETMPTNQNIIATVGGFNSLDVPIRLTFTNSMIKKSHTSDLYSNILMEFCNNGKNEVLVNSEILENYLRKKFPDFKYILSTTACVNTLEELEKQIQNYYLVVPDYNLNNTDELFKVSNPKKCEIILNDFSCVPQCPYRKEHYDSYSKYNIKESFDYMNCRNDLYKNTSFLETIKTNKTCITKEDLYGKYVEAGFENFKIVGRTDPNPNVVEFYLYYLVKPEYYLEVYEGLMYE